MNNSNRIPVMRISNAPMIPPTMGPVLLDVVEVEEIAVGVAMGDSNVEVKVVTSVVRMTTDGRTTSVD